MREISLHILDIVQNSLAAQAGTIKILVKEEREKDVLFIEIADDGCGMSEDQVKKALDPFYTTRTTRKVGLGLSLLQANCQACGGDIEIVSSPGQGTVVKASFKYHHIDRPPLGDMVSTLVALMTGAPQIRFVYCHHVDGKEYCFDTAQVKELLEDVPINSPEVITWLKGYLREKEEELVSQ